VPLDSALVLLVTLEEVADLVDGFGCHHPADNTDRQARRTGGDRGTDARAGGVPVVMVVLVVTVVPIVALPVGVRISVSVRRMGAIRGLVPTNCRMQASTSVFQSRPWTS